MYAISNCLILNIKEEKQTYSLCLKLYGRYCSKDHNSKIFLQNTENLVNRADKKAFMKVYNCSKKI